MDDTTRKAALHHARQIVLNLSVIDGASSPFHDKLIEREEALAVENLHSLAKVCGGTVVPADATLLLAAPDLATALKGLIHEATWDDEHSDRERFEAALYAANLALAKAGAS